MTPWTALLESLHSALIDELTERHPEPKPTLGLPIRQANLTLPRAQLSVLAVEFSFDNGRGLVMVASEAGFMRALELTPLNFWKAIVKRAGSEFMRRFIKPKSGAVRELKLGEPIPENWIHPSRVVWIPFQLPQGTCFLGMAV